MRDHVLIHLNGRSIGVGGEEVFLTLSEFLRRRQRLTGTKVVCAEGDCGSCAVLVGKVDGGELRYSSITSCIQLMFQLDGAHVITVEGLRAGDSLNPIQKSMVECHGTQCGFCTPGFVVSLYDLMHEGRPCDSETVRRGLVGNLCRCTGYDSIINAALSADRAGLKSIGALYPDERMKHGLTAAAGEEVLIEAGSQRFYKPISIEQAVRFRAEHPGCVIVSGATDIGVQCNKHLRELVEVMSLGGLTSLRTITIENQSLQVGAAATLSELERTALEHLPELGRFLSWFGSPLIKNSGTIGGNLVNGSPIADTVPALFVLDAEIEIAGVGGTRRMNVNQFYTGYRKTVLKPDEIVTAVHIPIPAEDVVFKLYKVSRRKDLDISTFSAAIWMQKKGEKITEIRIAYGGVAATVVRLSRTEAFLRGGIASAEQFDAAGAIAAGEVSPISDVRGSGACRKLLSENILRKFWQDISQEVTS